LNAQHGPDKGTPGANPYAHILWMGGSPCSGKSSIANLLAEQYGLVLYHVDEMLNRHLEQVTHETQPNLYKWTHTPWDDLWMQPPETLLQEAIGCYGEQLEMILQDLRALAPQERILAEGCSLLPDRVAEVMAEQTHGIWVVPSESFQRRAYRVRGAWVEDILAQCRDPEQAYQNWMDRDAAFARWIARRARALDLCVLTVSGQRTIEENAAIVARHFGL
jgi:2-phosphoglycerate kinase